MWIFMTLFSLTVLGVLFYIIGQDYLLYRNDMKELEEMERELF